jgi:CRP-like cAMP-binding protein
MSDDDPTIGLLRGLDPDAASELLEHARRRTVSADDVLFTEGGTAQAVHVLVSGVARLVQTTSAGARVIVKYVRPGEIFGSPALLAGRYPVDAIAVTEGVELQWSSEFIRDLIDRRPLVAINVIRDLETRLREMESKLRDLSSEPVEHRLARTILRLVDAFGEVVPEGVEIPFPISRQDLADLIGSTLPTVSRTLRAWESQRQIRRYRRRLVIADVDAVEAVLNKSSEPEPKPRRSHRRVARG